MVTFEFEDHPDGRQHSMEYGWIVRKRVEEIPFLPDAGQGPQLTAPEYYALVFDHVNAEWEAMKLHRQARRLTTLDANFSIT